MNGWIAEGATHLAFIDSKQASRAGKGKHSDMHLDSELWRTIIQAIPHTKDRNSEHTGWGGCYTKEWDWNKERDGIRLLYIVHTSPGLMNYYY